MKSKFHPELLIGISRGGLIPATILSHKTGIPLGIISIQTYDDDKKSGILKINTTISSVTDLNTVERALIIDDIADSGETLSIALNEIKRKIPHIQVATLHYKEKAIVIPDFYYEKIKENVWISYGWERG